MDHFSALYGGRGAGYRAGHYRYLPGGVDSRLPTHQGVRLLVFHPVSVGAGGGAHVLVAGAADHSRLDRLAICGDGRGRGVAGDLGGAQTITGIAALADTAAAIPRSASGNA